MKSKIAFISSMILLSILVAFYVFGLQEARWKGKIEKPDGVKIIKNPNKPLYGETEFELEEDLSIW
jgi:hypothetical protein